MLLKTFLCLPLTVGSVGIMVKTPDWESVGCEFKYRIFFGFFWKRNSSLISLILNIKSEKHILSLENCGYSVADSGMCRTSKRTKVSIILLEFSEIKKINYKQSSTSCVGWRPSHGKSWKSPDIGFCGHVHRLSEKVQSVNRVFRIFVYRSGTVNSKSFVGKVLLWIKWKFELIYAL